MASSKKEAVKLATRKHEGVSIDEVLFGSVGDWEAPSAYELKLPKGYRIIEERPRLDRMGEHL